MTNHSLFQCFFPPFDLCRYPLMEESVFADTWETIPSWLRVRWLPPEVPWRRSIGHLFQCRRYFLLLPGESQSGFIPRGDGWRQGLLTWRRKRKLSIISAFPFAKNTRMSERIYCSVAEEQGNTDHTRVLAGSSGTQGSICWKNKTGTPPDNNQTRSCVQPSR